MIMDEAPCPVCGAAPGALSLAECWEVPPLGTWSLAGAQLKTPARVVPVATCAACGLYQRGSYDPDGRHVSFPRPPARPHGPAPRDGARL